MKRDINLLLLSSYDFVLEATSELFEFVVVKALAPCISTASGTLLHFSELNQAPLPCWQSF
jgi:hypothetical protein